MAPDEQEDRQELNENLINPSYKELFFLMYFP